MFRHASTFRYSGLLLSALLVAACSSNKPKLAELAQIQNPVSVKVAWSTNAGSGEIYQFAPAVDRSRIFVAGQDGTLTRLDAGQQLWRVQVAKSLAGGVAVGGDTVVVTTPKAEVIALSAINGEPLWQSTVSTEVLAPALVTASSVIVKSGDNRLHALDILTGKIKWSYQRGAPALTLRTVGSPVLAENYVFSGFPNGRLLALQLDNGALVWEGSVSSPKGTTELERVADIVASPTIDGRSICASAYQGKTTCFDLGASGAALWSRDLASANALAVDTRNLYLTDSKGFVWALEKATGKTVWKQESLANRQLTAPTVVAGMVVVGDAQGEVHFLQKEDGRRAGRYQLDSSPITATPKTMGSTVIVQTRKGGVYALETQ